MNESETLTVPIMLLRLFGAGVIGALIGYERRMHHKAIGIAGMVLVAQSIRDSIERGLRYFDFLRGDEAYKCRLTKSSRKTITLLVARSFLAKEYLRVARLKDSVKRLVSGNGVTEPVF